MELTCAIELLLPLWVRYPMWHGIHILLLYFYPFELII